MEKFLKSKFKIGKKISENPYSLTYDGTTLSGEVPIIIKTYKRGTLSSSLIKTMKQKVKFLAETIHPKIVSLLDGDYGWQGFYYVRPYIKGPTLNELIRSKQIDQEKAEEILVEVCEALETAHKKGIVHGALKPSNIFIEKDGVKLVDFIIEGEIKESIPQKSLYIMENEDSLSPEEITGSSATKSSDIFSVGVLFYKMLLGKSPFENQIEKIKGNIKALPSAPKYMQDILQKALNPDPLLRFKSISEMLESIRHKTLIDKTQNLDLPTIDLENTPHPEEKEVYIETEERKKSFFLGALVLISALAGIIYAIINTVMSGQ